MGWLKDLGKSIYKGIKKVGNALGRGIKSVAKRVKKISKKIITALPGGKKLWEVGGKIGTGLLKGMSKLGPLGTLALNFVVPGIGNFFSGLMSSAWGAFGAGAASWASSANAVISTLGKAGGYIFDSGNFIKGTMGAFGDAVSKGTDRLMSGDFSGAIKDFSTNIKAGISGDAGFAAVDAGNAAVSKSLMEKNFTAQDTSEWEQRLGKDWDKVPEVKTMSDISADMSSGQYVDNFEGIESGVARNALRESSMPYYDPNVARGVAGQTADWVQQNTVDLSVKDLDGKTIVDLAPKRLTAGQVADPSTITNQRSSQENQRQQQQITGGYADSQPLLSPFTGAARAVKMGQAVGGVGAQGSLMVNAGLQPIEALNRSLLAQVQRGY